MSSRYIAGVSALTRACTLLGKVAPAAVPAPPQDPAVKAAEAAANSARAAEKKKAKAAGKDAPAKGTKVRRCKLKRVKSRVESAWFTALGASVSALEAEI